MKKAAQDYSDTIEIQDAVLITDKPKVNEMRQWPAEQEQIPERISFQVSKPYLQDKVGQPKALSLLLSNLRCSMQRYQTLT